MVEYEREECPRVGDVSGELLAFDASPNCRRGRPRAASTESSSRGEYGENSGACGNSGEITDVSVAGDDGLRGDRGGGVIDRGVG